MDRFIMRMSLGYSNRAEEIVTQSGQVFFFSSRRRHTRYIGDWSSDVCSSDLFKVDWALDGPIPWRADDCARAGTVHLGGSFEEISASEWGAWSGRPAGKPFVLLAQTSLFDPSRVPAGKQAAWAYCHVPNGSSENMTEWIEAQVERFAPGFRELILGRHAMGPAVLEAHNRNLVGGEDRKSVV